MKKIKYWFECRYWCSGVNSMISEGRDKEDDLAYRFFRFKYFRAKKKLNQSNWL